MPTGTVPPRERPDQPPNLKDFLEKARRQARINARILEERRRQYEPYAEYFRELQAIIREENRKVGLGR